jgi:hypothetical protein
MATPPAPDPYAPPRAPLDAAPGSGSDERLTREEVKAFVGKNHGYYWAQWSDPRRQGRLFQGFNFAAAFFGLFWLLYRRMYREFAWLMGAYVGLGVVEAVADAESFGNEVNLITRVVGFVVTGALGNGLYLRRARAAARSSRLAAQPEAAHAHIVARGGTSWIAAGVGMGGTVALLLLLR